MKARIASGDLLAILEERPYRTREIGQLFNVSYRAVLVVCSELEQAGQVERISHDGQMYWARVDELPEIAAPIPAPPARNPAVKHSFTAGQVEYVSVWNGRESLDVLRPGMDHSCTSGMGQSLATAHTFVSTGRRV